MQVFSKDGKFVREFTVAPETLDRGSTGGLTFSRPDQTFIYFSDIMNNVVWIVNRGRSATSDSSATPTAGSTGCTWWRPIRRGTSTPARSIPGSACSDS